MKKLFLLSIFATAIAVIAVPATAADMIDEQPSEADIIRALQPAQGEQQEAKPAMKMKFRAIRRTPAATNNNNNISPAPATAQAVVPKRVALTVNFETGSAVLSEDSKTTLATLGKALNSSQLEKFTFLIEGHTDSVGDDSVNLSLSEKRARAVKGYMVKTYGVDASRLAVIGKGESELLDAKQPSSGRNRRVEIVNLGE